MIKEQILQCCESNYELLLRVARLPSFFVLLCYLKLLMAPKEGKEGKGSGKNRTGGKTTNEPSPELPTEDPPEYTRGYGKFYYPSGATYEGEWIIAPDPNAELDGKTKKDLETKSIEKGSKDKGDKTPKDDKKKGAGKSTPKSPKQEATKDNSRKQPEGQNVGENGSSPPGEQEQPRPNRFRHGRGVYTDGKYQYEGDWRDDQICGQGTFQYASGASYEGSWDANKYFGVGEYKWGDRSSYKGDWRENKMHGAGVYIDKAGQQYVGHFFNGVGPGLPCEIE